MFVVIGKSVVFTYLLTHFKSNIGVNERGNLTWQLLIFLQAIALSACKSGNPKCHPDRRELCDYSE